MWTLSPSAQISLHLFWLTFDLGTSKAANSNRTRYLDRYCYKPQIIRKGKRIGVIFLFMGCSIFHHYPNFSQICLTIVSVPSMRIVEVAHETNQDSLQPSCHGIL